LVSVFFPQVFKTCGEKALSIVHLKRKRPQLN
jgi:hypothetical protein